jgi:hypothetical protein
MAATFSPDGNERNRMVALWNQGRTLAQIATTFGCSTAIVDATIKALSTEGCFSAISYTGL